VNNRKRKSQLVYYSLATHEFHFLLSQFAPVTALGWENPYTGWLAEEVELVQKDALSSLIKRDFVRLVGHTEIAIDENVAKLFGACAHPDFSLIVAVSKSGRKPTQSVLHSKEGAIVEQIIKTENHTVRQLENWDDILAVLSPPASKKSGSSRSKEATFHVSESTLAECEELLKRKKISEARTLLLDAIKDSKRAELILDVLDKPLLRAAVILVPGPGFGLANSKSGMVIYQSATSSWILQPFERARGQFIDFKPGDRKTIHEEFMRLIPS
jgi:hypothetical protein